MTDVTSFTNITMTAVDVTSFTTSIMTATYDVTYFITPIVTSVDFTSLTTTLYTMTAADATCPPLHYYYITAANENTRRANEGKTIALLYYGKDYGCCPQCFDSLFLLF